MHQFVIKPTLASLGIVLVTLLSFTPALALGTPAGTPITNQATVDYTDANGNPLQTLSNIVTTIVSQVSSVTVDPDRASPALPGDTVYYAHTVTNNGNGNDTIDLTAVSSTGWVTALYFDADGSGTFTPGDTVLGDTDGDVTPDTGVVPANGTFLIVVSVAVPPGTANAVVDTVTVTGTSSIAPFAFDTALDTTTVNAPNVSVVKSVLPAGPQPPFTVLTYTIVVTNNGLSDAAAVVVTDPIPGFTTYVPGSMSLNGGGLTDGSLDDAGDFGITTLNAITVSIGTLIPGGSATVTFQVLIN